MFGLLKKLILSIFYFFCGLYQYLAPQKLEIKRIELYSQKLLKDYKIVQLSDFHYEKDQGFFTKLPDDLLIQAIDCVNKENPDFIFLTGDFIDSDQESISILSNFLQKLKCKKEIIAVFGNHDGKNIEFCKKTLENIGITVLCGNSKIIDELEIVGTHDMYHPDYWNFKNIKLSQNDEFRIILTHNPKSFFHLKMNNITFDIQISGHYHGGQICLPNGTPLLYYITFIVNYIPNFEIFKKLKHYCNLIDYQLGPHGLYEEYERKLYINKGLGTHPPMRLFCNPEISIISLKNL